MGNNRDAGMLSLPRQVLKFIQHSLLEIYEQFAASRRAGGVIMQPSSGVGWIKSLNLIPGPPFPGPKTYLVEAGTSVDFETSRSCDGLSRVASSDQAA